MEFGWLEGRLCEYSENMRLPLSCRAILCLSISFLTVLSAQEARAADLTELDWAADAVFYQVYLERFRNGDPNNDPTGAELEAGPTWQLTRWTGDWYARTADEDRPGAFYHRVNERRYGGDLQGLIDRLDYLAGLGVTAIYLNPLFEAFSHHKYDGSSFHHIDNNFGPDARGDLEQASRDDFTAASWSWTTADRLFLKTIEEAHKRKMRVVIDGVFNHVGTRFPPFQEVMRNQQKSKYTNWFTVVQWDDPGTPQNEFNYKGWWNIKALPEFRENEMGLVDGPREYVFAITRRWMDPDGDGNPEDGVDGWRLDVAGEVAHAFWRDWRKLVKSINPNALLIGEIWDNARAWLQGDEFDSVMNYPLAKSAIRFFVDTDNRRLNVTGFDRELKVLRESYPERLNYYLLNLYDSHDTDRLASMIKNPNREYDRDASPQNNSHYDVTKPSAADRQVQKLMALFQMTYLGAPMIYYGTEAGLWGADDPDDRKPMIWAEKTYDPEINDPLRRNRQADEVTFDSSLFDYYQRLIRIRTSQPALRRGSFHTLLIDDAKSCYAYERTFGTESVIVILNNGSAEQSVTIPKDGRYTDLFNGGNVPGGASKLTVVVSPKSGLILKKI